MNVRDAIRRMLESTVKDADVFAILDAALAAHLLSLDDASSPWKSASNTN